MIDVIQVKQDIIENNDEMAEKVREVCKNSHTFFVNLMGSPGCGKTTTLVQTIKQLKDEYRIAVIEADVDSVVDAETIEENGAKAIQVHTGGSCHMDANMTLQALHQLSLDDYDLVILENVGNLVCPAEFDVGANLKVMILSVPEGDDKPLKYPLMFTVSDALLVNKIDTKEIFDFDMDKLRANIQPIHADMPIFEISAFHNQGVHEWTDWLKNQIQSWRESCSE